MATQPDYSKNITRNPFSVIAPTAYCKNMTKLKVFADGVEIENRRISDIFVNAWQRRPYLILFEYDDNGRILLEDNGSKPRYTLHEADQITIDGKPQTCGCWRARRHVPNWWRNVESGLW